MHPNASSGTQRQQRDRQTDPQAVTLRANTRTQRTAQTAPRPRSGRFGSDITPTHAIIRTPAAHIQQHESSADRTQEHTQRDAAAKRRTADDRCTPSSPAQKPARTTKRPDQSSRPIPERMEQSDPLAPAAHTDALGVHARRANDADGHFDVTRIPTEGFKPQTASATHTATPRRTKPRRSRTPAEERREPYMGSDTAGAQRHVCTRTPPAVPSDNNAMGKTGPQAVTLRANDRTHPTAQLPHDPLQRSSPLTRPAERRPRASSSATHLDTGHRSTPNDTPRNGVQQTTDATPVEPRAEPAVQRDARIRAAARFRNAWSRRTRPSRFVAVLRIRTPLTLDRTTFPVNLSIGARAVRTRTTPGGQPQDSRTPDASRSRLALQPELGNERRKATRKRLAQQPRTRHPNSFTARSSACNCRLETRSLTTRSRGSASGAHTGFRATKHPRRYRADDTKNSGRATRPTTRTAFRTTSSDARSAPLPHPC